MPQSHVFYRSSSWARASQVALVVENTCQCRKHERHEFDPGIKNIPWGTAWPPTPVFLPGESHRRRSLAAYSP